MKRCLVTLSLAGCFLLAVPIEACNLTTTLEDERIDVFVDGVLFTSYRFPSNWKFPYLWPIIGPASGESLTIEEGIGHPHHRSLYLACDQVNGCNFWQEGIDRGRQVSLGPQVLEQGARVVIQDRCDWVCSGRPSPIRDTRTIIISAPEKCARWIECIFDIEFKVDTTILPSNHALFSAEVIPEISVRGGGMLTDSLGGEREAETFGSRAEWCDYSGNINGHDEGLTLYQHPGLCGYPWPFFTRDYGFMSPTPMYWLPPQGIQFKQGEHITLRFLVLVHSPGADKPAIEAFYQKWKESEIKPFSDQ